MNRRSIPQLILLTAILLCQGQAFAATSMYYVRHDFAVVPAPGLGGIPIAFGIGSGYAYAQATQGTTMVDYHGFVGPLPGALTTNAAATVGSTSANSSATVTLGYTFGGGIQGSTIAQGLATATATNSSAIATSYASSFVVVGAYDWRRGRINWTGAVGDGVGGFASAQGPARPRDPITIIHRDPAGNVINTNTLADISVNFNISTDTLGNEVEHDDASLYQWDNLAGFSTTASNFMLNVMIDSPLVDPADRGTLSLIVANNIVTHAQKTGRFSLISLPGLGTDVSGTGVALPDLDIDNSIGYNIESLNPGPGETLEFGFEFGMVPEPTSTSGLLLGLAMFLFMRRRH